MPQKSKTPVGTVASRDSFAGLSHTLPNPVAMQVQFLIAAYHIRPELTTMFAALAFGGGACHG